MLKKSKIRAAVNYCEKAMAPEVGLAKPTTEKVSASDIRHPLALDTLPGAQSD